MMLEIYKELQGVAELVAKRMPEVASAAEVTLADADRLLYRMAINWVFIYEKPELEAILNEVERLARQEINKPKKGEFNG